MPLTSLHSYHSQAKVYIQGTGQILDFISHFVAAHACLNTCADSFVRGGPTMTPVLVSDGRQDQNVNKSGSSSARQRNALLMVQH